jgi:hypothetical protein
MLAFVLVGVGHDGDEFLDSRERIDGDDRLMSIRGASYFVLCEPLLVTLCVVELDLKIPCWFFFQAKAKSFERRKA